jgi:hypothetical protein
MSSVAAVLVLALVATGCDTLRALVVPSGVTDYTIGGLDAAGCEVGRMLVSLTAGPEGPAPPQAC